MKQPQELITQLSTLAHLQELCAQLEASIPPDEQPDVFNLLQELTVENYPDHWDARDLKNCIRLLEIMPVILQHCKSLN